MRFLFLFLFILSFVSGIDLALKLQKLIDNKSEKSIEILKYNPFFTKKEIKQMPVREAGVINHNKRYRKRALSLVAILNHRAFVGGKWIGKDDIIDGYRVEKILQDSVILINKEEKKILRFKKIKDILKIREK